MKTEVNCLREFGTLVEDKRPSYLLRIGKFTTTNAAKFPLLVPDGPTITIRANALFSLLSAREDGGTEQTAYDKELAADIKMMETVYDYIDLVAKGDGTIIALSGARGTSVNTTSVGVPSTPAGLIYQFADGAGEMILTRDTDKLAKGSVTVTYTNPLVKVIKSGNTQLTITCPKGENDVIVNIDLETVLSVLIENQVEASKINSVMSLYNANGLSPIASPAPIVVPR